MPENESVVVKVGFEAEVEDFKKSYEGAFKEMEKQARHAGKAGQGAIGDFVDKAYNKFKRVPKMIEDAQKASTNFANKGKALRGQHQADVRALREKQTAYEEQTLAFRAGSKEESAAHQKTLSHLEAEVAKYKKVAESRKKDFEDAEQMAETMAEKVIDLKFQFSSEKLAEAAGAAGAAAIEPLSMLLSKDLPGALKSGSKLIGKTFQSTFQGAGWGLGVMGAALQKKGAARTEAGKKGGGAMEGMGKFMSSLGPLIQSVGKLGPLLGLAGGAVAGLIKLFLDADAMVKEFNKGMLEAGGMGQYFGKGMTRAGDVVDNAMASMDDFREAAYSLNNVDWGTTANTHKEVVNALQAEGVSVRTMQKEYRGLSQQSEHYSKTVGVISESSVVWSRLMGVSLQEVTGFIGEMVSDTGAAFTTTNEAMHQMNVASRDSGISANKFFAQIRGISADLDLYNNRVGTAVQLFGKLGKVMSPRNARAFMQTAMNAYKGKSYQDKVKSSILAGDANVAKIVNADIDSKNKSIAKEMAESGAGDYQSIHKALVDGNDDLVEQFIGALDPEKQGAFRGAVHRLGLEKKRASGGKEGMAAAIDQVDMVGAMELRLKEASAIGGKLTSKGKWNMKAEVGATPSGMTDEERINAEGLEKAINGWRKELVKQGKMTQTEADAADWTTVFNTMDKKTKAEAMGLDAEVEAAKNMGTNVQSVSEKLDTYVAFFMNKFYNLVMSLYEAILDLPGMSSAKREDAKFLKSMSKVKNPAAQAALAEAEKADSGHAAEAYKDSLVNSKEWKQIVASMTATGLQGEKEEKRKDLVSKGLKSMDGATLVEAMKNAGISPELQKKLEGTALYETKTVVTGQKAVVNDPGAVRDVYETKKVWKGGDVAKIMEQAGFTPEQITTTAAKMGWASSTDGTGMQQFIKTIGDLSTLVPPVAPVASGDPKKVEGAPPPPAPTTPGATPPNTPPVAPPTPATAPAPAPTTATAPVTAKQAEKAAEVHEEQQQTFQGTLSEVLTVLSHTGIRLNKSWMDNHMKKMIEEATLSSLRTALVENMLLEAAGPEAVADAIRRGVDPKALGPGVVQGIKDSKLPLSPGQVVNSLGGPHAAGGFVTGINREGIALVAPGEQIIPVGGSGGGAMRVELSLKGDLGALIEAKAQQVVVQHDAARKYR